VDMVDVGDAEMVDVRALVDHSSGKKTYVPSTQRASHTPTKRPHLYTQVKGKCEALCELISSHPALMTAADAGITFLLDSLSRSLPPDELAGLRRHGDIHSQSPPKRSRTANDDRQGSQ
jgi:hypothetical protein